MTQLDALGFVWDCLEEHWNVRMAALTTYKEIYGDVLVPTSFVVPEDDVAWPKELVGLKVGFMVSNLRSSEGICPPARKAELNALGFRWKRQ